MGYDISYHPVKESELNEWYFDLDFTRIVEGDYSEVERLAEAYALDPDSVQYYKDLLATAVDTEPEAKFENTHGYYAAVVQGFYKKYFYTRGSGFSFLIDEHPYFKAYTKPWEEIIKYKYPNRIYNQLQLNYSSGCYIPAAQVERLLADYQAGGQVKADLDAFFSDGRIDIFLTALNFAREHGDGILEATEVIEPNPLDLSETKCYSYLLNCDVAGAKLYQAAAQEQIREIEQREGLAEGEIANNANYQKTQIPMPQPEKQEKKGFFKRLFG